MATMKAEAVILTFAVEIPQYVTSSSHSLLSSSPHGRSPSRSMTATANLFLAYPALFLRSGVAHRMASILKLVCIFRIPE